MSLAAILHLFLTHLGIGVAFTLLLVSREAGVKFFRFNAGLALALLVSGMLFGRRSTPAVTDAISTAPAFGPNVQIVALATSAACLLIYWLTIGRGFTRVRPLLLPLACVAGIVGIAAQAMHVAQALRVAQDFSPANTAIPFTASTLQYVAAASFLSSAALLGGACTAMILGHWYLVLPGMDVLHLQSIVKFHILSLIVRIVLVGAVVFFAIAAWQPGSGPGFARYIFSVAGIFFWQRVLFGLFGPALLAYLTWETAKIRSTQSATGILYVDFFTIIVGEVLAKYVLLATAVPV